MIEKIAHASERYVEWVWNLVEVCFPKECAVLDRTLELADRVFQTHFGAEKKIDKVDVLGIVSGCLTQAADQLGYEGDIVRLTYQMRARGPNPFLVPAFKA